MELPDWEGKKTTKTNATNTRVKVLEIVIDYFNEAQRLNQDDIIWYQFGFLIFWCYFYTNTVCISRMHVSSLC